MKKVISFCHKHPFITPAIIFWSIVFLMFFGPKILTSVKSAYFHYQITQVVSEKKPQAQALDMVQEDTETNVYYQTYEYKDRKYILACFKKSGKRHFDWYSLKTEKIEHLK